MDTFIDGCGVALDLPIGEGTRIRFKLEEDRQQDITVFVKDGALHIQGMNRPVFVHWPEENYIQVGTVDW